MSTTSPTVLAVLKKIAANGFEPHVRDLADALGTRDVFTIGEEVDGVFGPVLTKGHDGRPVLHLFATAANQRAAAANLSLTGPRYDLGRDPGASWIDVAAGYLEKGTPMTVSFNTTLPTEVVLTDGHLALLEIELKMRRIGL